jgi:hypothetical protein
MLDALLGRFRRFGSGATSDASWIVRQSCFDRAGQDTAALGRPIAISHRIDMNNIGDRSNPIAVQFATGRPTFWTPPAIRPSLLGIGAILHWATAKSHVWGTGMTAPDLGSGGLRAERVWALRGKLTHANLARQLVGLRDVPLGDPGYLVGRCIAALMPARAPIHQLGIVPHFKDRNHPAIGHLRCQDGVVVLGGWDPDPAFFKQMMACEAIASSSLHGLIFAEAAGIPNTWVDFASEGTTSTFKYHDWFSLAKKPPQHPLRLTASPDAANIIASCALHEMAVDENALRRAVPSAALDELRLPRHKAPRIVHFLTCRRRPIPIFLICGNQGHRLHDLVAAYRKQSLPSEPILVAADSVDQETSDAIDRLRREGAIARGLGPRTPDQQARSLRDVIRLHFKDWGEPQRFAVATGSVDFSIASADSFAVYDELLNCFPAISGAGPMLRIRDLPQDMPHFARIMSAEIAAHWQRPPRWCETSFGPAAIVNSSLGGTFALRRAGEKYNEPGNGLRVHYPFEARNLDWKVADGPASTDSDALRIDPYTVVERGTDGTLMTTTIVSGELC